MAEQKKSVTVSTTVSNQPCKYWGYIVTGAMGDISVASSAALAAAGSGYATGNTITLTGGTVTTNAVLTVATTQLVSAAVNAPGTGYATADTITLAGGTFSAAAVLTVASTRVSALPTIAAAGTGGTPGSATVTGTTGTGTKFQATVTIDGTGVIVSVDALTVAGAYTVNPTVLTAEPVTGGGLTGAQLSIVMGVNTFTVSTPGSYTVESATFTQSATSGTGTGATFNTGLFGVLTATVSTAGAYTTTPADPVAQGATSGTGTGATFNMTWSNVVAAGVTLYDNTSASGTVVDIVPDNAVAGTAKTLTSPVRCTTGLYASVAGTGSILFLYD